MGFSALAQIGLTQQRYGSGQPRGDCPYKQLNLDILRKSCQSNNLRFGGQLIFNLDNLIVAVVLFVVTVLAIAAIIQYIAGVKQRSP
ncbi:MAG: hypothetical protein F6J93_39940 [Oscillatoria sp. SIO1A7]|nr:hypothetical protein [Oscillatoria sp. SIO1A7]